jgi:cAMP-binding proteins - catabolite gene activator and regulatory subunit of cAMP-dependent protein kinases
MFQELGPKARQAAARAFRPLRVRRGSVLYREGDEVEGLYLVREGFIWLGDARVEPATLGVVGPGGLFGEEALVGERARTLGATALTYAELLFAPKEELAALLEAFPEAQGFFLRALYARLKAAEARLWEARHLSVAQRLARLLLALGPGEVGLSHQDLARMVGATRETVTKLLGEWALKGVVDLGYRRLQVLDPKALARLGEAL